MQMTRSLLGREMPPDCVLWVSLWSREEWVMFRGGWCRAVWEQCDRPSVFLLCLTSGSLHLNPDSLERFHSCALWTPGMFWHVDIILCSPWQPAPPSFHISSTPQFSGSLKRESSWGLGISFTDFEWWKSGRVLEQPNCSEVSSGGKTWSVSLWNFTQDWHGFSVHRLVRACLSFGKSSCAKLLSKMHKDRTSEF